MSDAAPRPAGHGSDWPATRLYAIADFESLGADAHRYADCVVAMVRGGVRLLQLRLKPADARLAGDDMLRYGLIERTLDALDRAGRRRGLQLWLDDRADLAVLFPGAFAGVHVGQHDLPPSAVHRLLLRSGGGPRIGLSCHDLEQVRRADSDPCVDWVAIGPVHATRSKPDPDPVVGLDGVRQARAATAKPLVAIGGLQPDCLRSVLDAGADAAVVLGALVAGGAQPSAIEATARRLVAAARERSG